MRTSSRGGGEGSRSPPRPAESGASDLVDNIELAHGDWSTVPLCVRDAIVRLLRQEEHLKSLDMSRSQLNTSTGNRSRPAGGGGGTPRLIVEPTSPIQAREQGPGNRSVMDVSAGEMMFYENLVNHSLQAATSAKKRTTTKLQSPDPTDEVSVSKSPSRTKHDHQHIRLESVSRKEQARGEDVIDSSRHTNSRVRSASRPSDAASDARKQTGHESVSRRHTYELAPSASADESPELHRQLSGQRKGKESSAAAAAAAAAATLSKCRRSEWRPPSNNPHGAQRAVAVSDAGGGVLAAQQRIHEYDGVHCLRMILHAARVASMSPSRSPSAPSIAHLHASAEAARLRSAAISDLLTLHSNVSRMLTDFSRLVAESVIGVIPLDPRHHLPGAASQGGDLPLAAAQRAAVADVVTHLAQLDESTRECVAQILTQEEKRFHGLNTHKYQTGEEKAASYQYAGQTAAAAPTSEHAAHADPLSGNHLTSSKQQAKVRGTAKAPRSHEVSADVAKAIEESLRLRQGRRPPAKAPAGRQKTSQKEDQKPDQLAGVAVSESTFVVRPSAVSTEGFTSKRTLTPPPAATPTSTNVTPPPVEASPPPANTRPAAASVTSAGKRRDEVSTPTGPAAPQPPPALPSPGPAAEVGPAQLKPVTPKVVATTSKVRTSQPAHATAAAAQDTQRQPKESIPTTTAQEVVQLIPAPSAATSVPQVAATSPARHDTPDKHNESAATSQPTKSPSARRVPSSVSPMKKVPSGSRGRTSAATTTTTESTESAQQRRRIVLKNIRVSDSDSDSD